MSDEAVRYAVSGAVATLTMDQQHNRNALTPALMSGLSRGLDAALADEAVGVIVLTNAGPAGGATVRAPLGRVAGARSGDKGGNANLGVWARTDAAYAWLAGFLTTGKLKELLPETAPLPVERHEFPGLRAVNFVIEGLLGEGVAASTRLDPQAKSLGEWLRARVVDIPRELLP